MIKTLQAGIAKANRQIRQAFLGIVARGGDKRVQLQGLDSEVLQDVEVMQHVGFAAYMPEGAKVLLIPLGGKTGRAMAVASNTAPVTVTVAKGEVCIYDQFGHEFRLSEAGASLNCDLSVAGSIKASGQVSDGKSSMQDMRNIYNSHVHGSSPTPSASM